MELIFIMLIACAIMVVIGIGAYFYQQYANDNNNYNNNNNNNNNVTYSSPQIQESYRIDHVRYPVSNPPSIRNDTVEYDVSKYERERQAQEERAEKNRLDQAKAYDDAEQSRRRMHYNQAIASGGDSDYYPDSTGRLV